MNTQDKKGHTPYAPHNSNRRRVRLLYLLLLSLLLAVSPRLSVQAAPTADDGAPGQWRFTNPGGGGAFAAIGAGPTGIVLAASDLSGVYRSRDRGQTWDNIGAFEGLTVTHAGAVGFDTQDGGILYIGTDDGIFRSSNSGDSVQRVSQGGYISDIKISPSNPQIGYAAYHPAWNALQGQVYKTTDRGLSWQRISQNLPADVRILKLIVHPTQPGVVYLLSGRARFAQGVEAIFRSADGGTTWARRGAGLGTVMDVALDTQNPAVLYATGYVHDANGDYQVGTFHRSTDSGATWTQMADRTGAIWVDRDDAHAVRLIQVNHQWPWDPNSNGVWESLNGGATWSKAGAIDDWGMGWVQAYWLYAEGFDGPAKSLGEDLADPDALWWTNTQWVMATFDDGRLFNHQHTDEISAGHWQSRGFDNVVLFDLAVSAADGRIYAGYYDIGCWRSDDQAASWQLCNDPRFSWSEGKGGNMTSVVTDPTRPGVVWAAQSRNVSDPNGLLRSADGGASWTQVTSGLPQVLLSGLSLSAGSPVTQRTLYVTADGDVYGSTDDGHTWSLRFDCNGCHFTAVDPRNGQIVYAGGEAGLWRSTGGGVAGSWQRVGPAELAGDANNHNFWSSYWAGVREIAPDPVRAGWVYVTAYGAGRGLYRSQDNGVTWQKLWSNDFARTVAVSPADPDTLYVTSSSSVEQGGYNAESQGILRSRDGGLTWQAVNDGLHWPFAGNIALTPGSPDRVLLDAPGNGVAVRDFAAPPTPTPPPVSGNLLSNGDFNQGADGWAVWGDGVSHQANGELCLFFDHSLPNVWDAGVDQSGFALRQGQRYRLQAQLWSQTAAAIRVIAGESAPPWANYWSQSISLPANAIQTVYYDFVMEDADDSNAGLFFHVGGHASPVLCLDSISLRALSTRQWLPLLLHRQP